MARARELVPGDCYFTVFYYDDELRIPDIDTLIYRGSVSDGEGKTAWLFHRPDGNAVDAASVPIAFRDENLHHVLDLTALRHELMLLAQHRSSMPASAHTESPGVDESASSELRHRLCEFLSGSTRRALTITVRHTDDGLLLCRQVDAVSLRFFLNVLRDDRDVRLIERLSRRGLSPLVDRQANSGGTRILEFSGPNDPGRLAELCEEVFVQILGMREGDAFNYVEHAEEGARSARCASS